MSSCQRDAAEPREESSAGCRAISFVSLFWAHAPASVMPGSALTLWLGLKSRPTKTGTGPVAVAGM